MSIEGLLAYMDFTTGKVLKIVDEAEKFSGKVDLNYFDEDSVKGSMPEMVVPYGAPDLLQASYNFFDAGEYRLGQVSPDR